MRSDSHQAEVLTPDQLSRSPSEDIFVETLQEIFKQFNKRSISLLPRQINILISFQLV